MDLMAIGASGQWISGVGRDADKVLPFYSRYRTAGTAGVDVLDQGVTILLTIPHRRYSGR